MRHSHLFILCCLASALLHILLLMTTPVLWLPGVSVSVAETRKMFNLDAVEPERPQQITASEVVENYVNKLKFQSPDGEAKTIGAKQLQQWDSLAAPEALPDTALLDERQTQALSPETAKAPQEDVAARKSKVTIQKRSVGKPLLNKETVEEIDVMEAWEKFTKSVGGDEKLADEFAEAMSAFTPAVVEDGPPGQGAGSSAGGAGFGDVRTIERSKTARSDETLAQYLDVVVETYRDPRDKQGYFQISIIPGPNAAALPVMPKEVTFLIDASFSINRHRIREFKQGIEYVLKNLNADDRFNILTFKENITAFRPAAVEADAGEMEAALDFVSNIHASQRTDFYDAFQKVLQRPLDMTPSYLLLFSDGRPNTGITNPVQIISDLTHLNQRKRSVFAFSGGERVNRFLLDFLAYENRGWSEYAPSEKEISQRIQQLYNKIRNPILSNLRFQLNPLEEGAVYPKHLPDFYRNTAFVLYGTYDQETTFSMRIVGEVNGEAREFLFTRDLSQARPGDAGIARRWALNKAYHLISQMTLVGFDSSAAEEIRTLNRRFDIRTPYFNG